MALQTTIQSQELLGIGGATFTAIPATSRGTIRVFEWHFNTTDDLNGGTMAGLGTDDVPLIEVPKGYGIYGGRVFWDDIGTGTAHIGIAGADGSGKYDGTNNDDPDFFASSIAVGTAAGTAVLPEDIAVAGARPYVTLVPVYITLQQATGTWDADRNVDGYFYIASP